MGGDSQGQIATRDGAGKTRSSFRQSAAGPRARRETNEDRGGGPDLREAEEEDNA